MVNFDEILKLYNLNNAKINELKIKSVNNTYRIDTKKGSYFLKKIYKFKGFKPENIYLLIEIAQHLDKKGIKTILPIKNIKGYSFSKINEDYFILYPYIEIDECETFNHEHFEFAASYLAKYHKAMKDFKSEYKFRESPLDKDIDSITGFTETPFNFRNSNVLSLAKKSNSILAKRVLKDSHLIKNAIIRVIHLTWGNFGNYEKSVLHYDYSPANFFYSKGNFVGVSDFDFSHRGYIETDVIKAARFWSTKSDGSIDLIKFKRFIYLYSKNNESFELNWKYFYGLLIFLVLRRLVYSASYTLEGKKDISFLYDQDIKTIEYLMENEL